MNEKLPPDDHPVTRTEAEGATVDLPEGLGFFAIGQVLGDRYEILEMLGRGGMGEVWRAFDLKLRVEVGLKALREELFQSERRLELLRQEVRAAREVVSPNVCRIFDLIEIDGRELVSMEFVDGATLLGVLQERGPLELKEAQDIASQFLSGLEAIHKAGLVHRDVKPENIMLTRAGRVVVMDFGLARGPESGAGSVSGTPAYMAPEHAAGQDVDARADVYSAGVVLAEMVSPEGVKSYESRQSVWEGVRSEPAKVPDTPWAAVIQRAVAKDRERRQNSAHTLIRELEEVTLRVEGAEDLHPYPGLASFTEDDAEFFFGREAEVERMWRKLEGPPRMLAIMGPSGAGKTSFIRAGVIPNAPADWAIIRCTPGNAAIASLRGALTSVLSHGSDHLTRLLTDPDNPEVIVDTMSTARTDHAGALLIVDQFEELFTLNQPEQQQRFTELLARLPLEANTHVVLSMRDDFAALCGTHETLQPIFNELTMLNPPTGGNLRRALVQPATKCGYRFEDDELVEEILAEVEGERGALPLLAFALARLWEKRDRETGLLTRQAYHDIGGVGGALARHAEATVDRIGVERIPIVRELFRNLVTAEGTRAVREWDELLSVFESEEVRKLESENVRKSALPTVASKGLRVKGQHSSPPTANARSSPFTSEQRERPHPLPVRGGDAAEDVLRELIDARLLTSYEVREDEHEPIRRVEIIHESLLANWPRLVRWQTQDADAVQLRDELRQAARTWDEHGRHDDRLWTGTAYREFQLWRECYPGGLTEIEEAFAAAIIALAGRRRRTRRITTIAALVVLASVAAVFAGLWRRSVLQERRAEAQKLVAIGTLRMEESPTASMAYAMASLDLADNEEARLLALEALWQGPTAFVVNEDSTLLASFSPRGKWLVQSRDFSSSLAIISADGRQRIVDHPTASGQTRVVAVFRGQEDVFQSWGLGIDLGRIALWSATESRMLASAEPDEDFDFAWGSAIDDQEDGPRALFIRGTGKFVSVDALRADGSQQRLGTVRLSHLIGEGGALCVPRLTGQWLGVVDGNQILISHIEADRLSGLSPVGRHEGDTIPKCAADPQGRFLVTATRSGDIRRWDVTSDRGPKTVRAPNNLLDFSISSDGAFFAATTGSNEEGVANALVWSMDGPRFDPVWRHEFKSFGRPVIDPVGLRVAMRGPGKMFTLWPLSAPAGAEPIHLRNGEPGAQWDPTFSHDGNWLATSSQNGLTLWPLVREYPSVLRPNVRFWFGGVKFGPLGRFLAASADAKVTLWPLEGAAPAAARTVLEPGISPLWMLAVSPDGEHLAVGSDTGQVWIARNDGSELRRLTDEGLPAGAGNLVFSADGRMLAALTGFFDATTSVFRVWDVESSDEIAALSLSDGEFRQFSGASFASDGRLLTGTSKGVLAWNLETGAHEVLVEFDVSAFAASEDGRRVLVMPSNDGQFGAVDENPPSSPVFFDLEAEVTTTLTTHGTAVTSVALDRKGTVAVTGDVYGMIRVGPVTGEQPHLLPGHEGSVMGLDIEPLGRRIASSGRQTIRLWPMPDLTKPPLHTLPREELIAKLKTLTNLRVVRDPESATGWKLTHDPFPGWETVPTW